MKNPVNPVNPVKKKTACGNDAGIEITGRYK